MNIKDLNNALPNVHEKYAALLSALDSRIEAEAHSGYSDKERKVLKSLTFAAAGVTIAAGSWVALAATAPVVAACLGVGVASLGKAAYHQVIEKSLSQQRDRLTSDYRSGALESSLAKPSLWAQLRAKAGEIVQSITSPASEPKAAPAAKQVDAGYAHPSM